MHIARDPVRRAVAVLVLACLLGSALAATAWSASRPEGFVRACGAIQVGKRHLAVDVAEGDGALVTCPHARQVARAFVRDHRDSFRVGGRKWECYKSRPGPGGWAYHCSAFARHGSRYVDVGVGRGW
jgi:hypothetical protein